jgi:hypothetical protein
MSLNYTKLLGEAIKESSSVETLKSVFGKKTRPGGKEKAQLALREIVRENEGKPEWAFVVSMAKELLKEAVASVPQGFGQTPPQGFGQTGAGAQASAVEVISMDEPVHAEKEVVKSQFTTESGIYRVVKEGENITLECLAQGHWGSVMSSEWKKVIEAKHTLLKRVQEKFGDTKRKEFQLGEKKYVYYGTPGSKRILTEGGKTLISVKQLENFYAPRIALFDKLVK